jgi:predicted KAP-like P-loop ATPase
MIEQEVMKKLGLAKLDKAECKSYAKKLSKEPWLTVLETAVDICVDKVPEYVAIYQKHINITKEQCDAKYSVFIDCMEITEFMVSRRLIFII